MSAIPPNWMASVLGASGAAQQAGVAKNKEAVDRAVVTDRTAFAEKLQNVIDQSDRDGAVYEDSEGLGSQGRAFSEDAGEQEQPDHDQDASPPAGLDVQA